RHGSAGLDHRRRGEDCLHRTRKPMGEWLHRELQCSPARRTPRRRDLLHAQRGQDHRGKLASALQHRASAWIARLQAAGAGGLHPGIRSGVPPTPTIDAARAGATTIIALTIKLDPSVGADHVAFQLYSVASETPCLRARSAAFAPASCSRSTAMICSSVNRFRFICPSFNQGRTLISVGGKTQWQVKSSMDSLRSFFKSIGTKPASLGGLLLLGFFVALSGLVIRRRLNQALHNALGFIQVFVFWGIRHVQSGARGASEGICDYWSACRWLPRTR